MACFKCYNCNEKFKNIEDLYEHLVEEHSDRIPKDFSPSRYYYYQKTGKTNGRCVECGSKTKWNEATHKYFRFCDNPMCKQKYSKRFKDRMIKKYGKVHLLNDPEQQKKMLKGRAISGEYIWSDGSKKSYVGSYEKSLLEALDKIFGFESADVECPSPHTYEYEYDGKTHFYIPDMFIHSIQTEIEVKDGGDNPNMHHKIQDVDKVKEKLKDEVLMTQNSFNYIKIVNKQNFMILKLLSELNKELADSKGNKDQEKRVFILEDGMIHYSKPVQESYMDENINPLMDMVEKNNKVRNIIENINTQNILTEDSKDYSFSIDFLSQIKKLNTPERLSSYMKSNTKYGYVRRDTNTVETNDFNDFFRKYSLMSPKEVYESGVGICWDQTLFEKYIFDNVIKKYDYKIFFLQQENSSQTTHTFLVFNKNRKYYYFENAFEEYAGIKEFESYDEVIKYVANNMRKSGGPDKGIYVNDLGKSYPKINSTCKEFFTFCKNAKELKTIKYINMGQTLINNKANGGE